MMNKISKLYKQFFGLTEQSSFNKTGAVKMPKTTNPADIKKMTDKGLNVQLESELDEAQLLNKINEYKGGVEYVIFDPANAQSVQEEIEHYAKKKGIRIIKKDISRSGKIGYFLFRLGEDPAKESQRIQGYISQMPQVKHFRFNVRHKETDIVPVKKDINRREL